MYTYKRNDLIIGDQENLNESKQSYTYIYI